MSQLTDREYDFKPLFSIGQKGEAMAAAFMRSLGYSIELPPPGVFKEWDFIAVDAEGRLTVEVKYQPSAALYGNLVIEVLAGRRTKNEHEEWTTTWSPSGLDVTKATLWVNIVDRDDGRHELLLNLTEDLRAMVQPLREERVPVLCGDPAKTPSKSYLLRLVDLRYDSRTVRLVWDAATGIGMAAAL